jgi:5'-3' exonuclease
MGVNGLMQFLKKQVPNAFRKTPKEPITGTAYVDTPLITMACGMVAQASNATIDPYALVKQKIYSVERLLKSHGAKEVRFVFDGPTRNEKIGTCVKRAETIKKQSEKRKREQDKKSLQIYRVEEDSEPDDPPLAGKINNIMILEEDSPAPFFPETREDVEDAPLELFHDEVLKPKPQTNLKIFQEVTSDHCLESDLYISSMIAHGTDTFVLKDLARFARISVGEKAIQAPHDSESYIASLVKKGDIGVTCDSDALPFGCEWVVQYIGTPKETWIHLEDILQGLNMTLHEFRVFCVLLGTDFNERLFLCGPTKSYPAVKNKTFQSFESFCHQHGKKYSLEEKRFWITSAEKSLLVFSSEKI